MKTPGQMLNWTSCWDNSPRQTGTYSPPAVVEGLGGGRLPVLLTAALPCCIPFSGHNFLPLQLSLATLPSRIVLQTRGLPPIPPLCSWLPLLPPSVWIPPLSPQLLKVLCTLLNSALPRWQSHSVAQPHSPFYLPLLGCRVPPEKVPQPWRLVPPWIHGLRSLLGPKHPSTILHEALVSIPSHSPQ